ncbi:MAG: DUF4872 domain-containing protein, partial [Candidatus Thorarchaeota archaeon]|nr:DUF4872 domain-containing protein [Candidatus Thorarchaeota archaeon]
LTMGLKQLQKARASEYRPFPAMNQMVRFSFPQNLTPLRELIPAAIRENVDALLNPPISNIGVKGIKRWSLELSKYPKLIPNPRNLAHALMMHYVYIETGGSGGAIFRQIYRDFLEEAGHIMQNDGILKAAEQFREIVNLWREVAKGLLPDEYPSLAELREIQRTVNVEFESKGIRALDRARKLTENVPALLDEAARSEISHFAEFIPHVRTLLEQVGEMERETMLNLASVVG